MLVRFIKDYGDVKEGQIRNTKTDEDAESLIASGVAEKYIATDNDNTEKEEAEKHRQQVDEIVAKVQEQLKAESKGKQLGGQGQQENPSGFKSLGEFAHCVIDGTKNTKLMNYIDNCKSTGMSEAINADGGFLIPPEFSTALLTAMQEQAVIAPKCRNFPINNNLTLPFVNNTTQATSWTGGVTIYKPAEGIQKTGSKPAMAQCELRLYKMAALIYATDELLADSPIALETFLSTMVSTEMALTRDEDIINGSGAGEALGVMNSPCLVSVSAETNQPADTITFNNVADMWMRLYSPSRANAVWLINQDCMRQIATMSIAVGTGGSNVFVVNATTAIPERLFGAPIVWSPHCQTLGDTGDIILADFSQYLTTTKAGRAGIETATSIHLKFDYDETAFRFIFRCDGQPWWASARTPKHGSSTVSPFVALEERA